MDRKILIDLLDDFAFGSHDIEQTADRITELYKQYQALQLLQTDVSGSFNPEQLQEYTNERIFKHLVVNYGLKLTYQEWVDKNYR